MAAIRNLIPLAAFAAFLAIGLLLVWTKSYPSDFDELEHVSYAAYLQETGAWRPMFEAMRDLPRDSLTHWSDRANYLGHPSPYYWFETLALDRSLPLHAAITRLRLESAALAMAGVALGLMAGWRTFGRDLTALAIFCALVALNPKLLAVSGQVTNDSLALLAGGLAYWGASTEPRRRAAGLAACAAGLMLACWAKPNAGLAVGAALGFYALLRLRARPSLLPALAVGGVLGTVPTWLIVAKYHALVPMTVEQFGGVHQVPGAAYLPVFLFNVAYTFCFAQTGAWPVPGGAEALAAALVWALLLAAAGGVWAAFRTRSGDPARLIAIVGPLAFVAVLPIHWWFSMTKLGGSVPAASFRYYLPIWPFLAHSVAFGGAGAGLLARQLVVGLSGAALFLGWLSP